ncbi:MAG: site-specific integrase [Chitinophagaceae bacterium]|nr:site-specific integrase [Chitinophagaceae bacterium]
MKKATYAAVLDTRYQKKDSDTYPVRLRITYDKTQKYYPTKFSFSEKQWKTMKGARPGDLKDTWLEIAAIESKAAGIIDKMKTFSFDQFKMKFDRGNSDTGLINTAFDEYIKDLKENDQIGTAISYGDAKKSLASFKPGLTFTEVTPDLLQQYERWMLKKGNSITTVGMYLRCLRSLFNKAIADGDLSQTDYPFGKRQHTIKRGAKRKIALSLSDVGVIYNYKPEPGSITEKAKDFFIFMYLGNGINIKDVCLLKYKDIEGQFIRHNRQKTVRTKTEQEEIRIHLKPEMKAIIKKWGNPESPDSFIFPVLTPGLSAEQIHAKKRDFNCLLNKHLKKIAKDCGVNENLTTYVARHTFATVLKRSGASTELISETLGHSDLKTTQTYLASFEDATLIQATDKLTAFKNEKSKQKARIVNL